MRLSTLFLFAAAFGGMDVPHIHAMAAATPNGRGRVTGIAKARRAARQRRRLLARQPKTKA